MMTTRPVHARASCRLDPIEYTPSMVVGEFTQDTDMLVVGGGPGGYAAAFRAAELGRKVLLVDPRSDLGGSCLHEGCIPTKTRLHRSAVGAEPGDRGQRAIQALAGGLAAKMKSLGIEHVPGTAHFEDARTVQVTGEHVSRVRFKRAIISTGSRSAQRDDLQGATTPEDIANIEQVPGRCIVVGNDYLAIEAASMLAGEGAAATLACEGVLLPELPRPLVEPLLRSLKKSGIALHEGPLGSLDADLVVDCSGRVPATDGLRLEQANIQVDETGWITVDEQQRTSEPRIFAVGDVTGPPHLAGIALAQGRVAAEAICGQPSAYDPAAVPHVVYSNPNIAWCGCLDATDDSSIASVPWGYSGRAVGMDASRGMTMLHWEQGSGLVLGVGICGSEACELIETAVLAIEMGATLEDLAAVVPAHPTRSELLGEAARAALLEQSTS